MQKIGKALLYQLLQPRLMQLKCNHGFKHDLRHHFQLAMHLVNEKKKWLFAYSFLSLVARPWNGNQAKYCLVLRMFRCQYHLNILYYIIVFMSDDCRLKLLLLLLLLLV